MLETLRCTGMRVGELVSLDCGDLVAVDRSASVVGKENKERAVFFDQRAWASLMHYLQARGYEDSQPVFSSHSHRARGKIVRLTTRTIEHVFARCLALADVQQKLTPHSFRHHFATRLLNETGDLALVQTMMGHASPRTTMIYVTVDRERMIQAHRQAFEGD
jgi:site-specific recombinase XerD